MNEIILANLLFQAGAGTVLMLVAGISAARELHSRRAMRGFATTAQPDSGTIVELPATRIARKASGADPQAHSEAA